MGRMIVGVSSLNDKQRLFIAEYLKDLNAQAAAIRAGYAPKGASARGSQLLKNPDVLQAIHRAMRDRERRCGVTQDQVIYGLMEEAEYYGPNCMHSARVSAWKALGLHLGMFTMKHAHGGDPAAPPIQHDHRHQVVKAEDLKLDQETAEKVLMALRQRKMEQQQIKVLNVEAKEAPQAPDGDGGDTLGQRDGDGV